MRYVVIKYIKLDPDKDNIVLFHARVGKGRRCVGKGRRQIHYTFEQRLNNFPADRLVDGSHIKSVVLVRVIQNYIR